MGHRDSHEMVQGPPHASSLSAFAAAVRHPYPPPLPQDPPENPPPPFAVTARPYRHALAHAPVSTEAQH